MSTIKAFHGTVFLDHIIKSGKIKANWNFRDGRFEIEFVEYDRITTDLASKVRKALRDGILEWGDTFDPSLVTSDEALADLASIRPTKYPYNEIDGKVDYTELKRNLFVCLANTLDAASRYALSSTRPISLAGVLELNLPTETIRSAEYSLGRASILLVPKEVSLEYLSGIHVKKRDFRKAVELLDVNRFENVKVEELK